MCDNICKDEKKYILGPAPPLMPQLIEDSPSTTVEVDVPIYESLVKPVIKNIIQETTINVPKIEYREKVVEVPRIEYRTYPVVKDIETPIYQDKYKYKNVEVPQKKLRVKPVYKVVDVPQIEYVDKYVKKKYKRFKYVPKEVQVPFRPRREIHNEVPIPRYIPQNINTIIQPDMFSAPYTGELPLFEGHNDNFLNMLNPFTVYGREKKNKCFLSCLCNGNDEATYEMNPLLVSSPPYNNQLCDISNNYELYPGSCDPLGYSYPFIIDNEENNFCNKIIEATSSIIAATGIAVILAGKLTLDGISLFLKSKNEENKKDTENILDSKINESSSAKKKEKE
ncbi:inner membrane complex protein 1m, putative [Plasmodium gallinaceum]|uniref:Inner membrane complex protein 1m, putative n=1 Tax=Plasmodium gallinaceum TaxID=5849 RepID=A0A1J1H1U8_PLAGA|nr:inner membrane complex protein 1m, putative [Plasmodium gallinaceum]CRG97302.1 inner membrane complex protein 1m, putative [Plasmodium gallinaceum]